MKYPSDGEIIDERGRRTGTMGFIAGELLDDPDYLIGKGVPLRRQKPPSDWGPERARLTRGAKENGI